MIEVTIPFYGDPAHLREAVASVLNQTKAPSRIVVLDDGYPDESVGAWVRAQPGVTYLRNSTNLGANGNYRKALDLSEGEYLVFMGADDRMLPNFIEKSQELIMRHSRPEVVQGRVRVIDGNGAPHDPIVDRIKDWCRPEPGVLGGQRAVASLLRGNWTYFPSLVWRRDNIKNLGFRHYNVVQDLALLVDTLCVNGRMLVDDSVTFEYRRHAASDSSLKAMDGRRFAEEREYFAQIESELASQGWHHAARAARWHLTSRLHAAVGIPRTLGHRDRAVISSAVRHAFGR